MAEITNKIILELTIEEAKLLKRFLGNCSIQTVKEDYNFTQADAITLLDIYDPLSELFSDGDSE
jgi:hypothetical protein